MTRRRKFLNGVIGPSSYSKVVHVSAPNDRNMAHGGRAAGGEHQTGARETRKEQPQAQEDAGSQFAVPHPCLSSYVHRESSEDPD